MKKHLGRHLNNERGMALIIAIAAVALISYLVTETTYETAVEYQLASSQVNDLKAHYAARAGVEISLLRLQIYRKAIFQFGKSLGGNTAILDPIWQTPFVWPPVIPKEVQRIDSETIKDSVKESFMKATYITTITEEGSKVDLGNLDSPSKILQERTREQLLNILYEKQESDPEWADDLEVSPEQIVDNIQDWIDIDTTPTGGGSSESTLYSDYSEGQWPPNRMLRTLGELRLIAGINQKVYELLAPKLTLYGSKGINVNLADQEVLQSLSPDITPEIAEQIIEYRNDPGLHGFFKDEKDFLKFMSEQMGVTLNAEDSPPLPITTDAARNFLITSTGAFAKSTREITALVYDLAKAQEHLQKLVEKEKKSEEKPAGDGQKPKDSAKPGAKPSPPAQKAKEEAPKGRPRVVFWSEK